MVSKVASNELPKRRVGRKKRKSKGERKKERKKLPSGITGNLAKAKGITGNLAKAKGLREN